MSHTPAKIVITSFGSFGDTFPYIGLALGLKERGYRPVLATSEFYRELIEGEGLDFHPVRPNVDPRDREMVRRVMDPTRGTEYIIRDLLMPLLRESYDDLSEAVQGATLLVSHMITFAAPLVAEREGLPWVSSVLAPTSFFSPHDLPVFSPAPWARRLGSVPGMADLLVRTARRMTIPWVAPVARLRAQLGLPERGNPIFEGQHSPHLALAMFSRVLADPQPDWPPSARITGSIPYDGPGRGARMSPRLEEFLGSGPPPIVFTLGSSAVGAPGEFYRASAAAVRRLGARAVLLVGPHGDNRPPDLPPGVLVESFAPHAALFGRAAAIVHQGGAGTLHQALRAGRPMLVVPHAHDQPDNAHRARRLGVARVVSPGAYTASRAAHELTRLLDDPLYRRSAEVVAGRVRAEDGVGDACRAIEGVIRGVAGVPTGGWRSDHGSH